MTEGEVPCLQIALIRGGKVDWIKSYGVKNAETCGPVTDDTIFEAASLSKPVFAYKLVEAGRLDADKPLQSYRLLAKKRNREAIEMFRMNVEDYAKSANVYDSLGEAYMVNGDKNQRSRIMRRAWNSIPAMRMPGKC